MLKFFRRGCDICIVGVQSNNFTEKTFFGEKRICYQIRTLRGTFLRDARLWKLHSPCPQEFLKKNKFLEMSSFFVGHCSKSFRPFVEKFPAGLWHMHSRCPKEQIYKIDFFKKNTFHRFRILGKNFGDFVKKLSSGNVTNAVYASTGAFLRSIFIRKTIGFHHFRTLSDSCLLSKFCRPDFKNCFLRVHWNI